MATQKLVIFTL